MAYFEICTLLKEGGWKELQDEAGSPYILKDDQWIGYDTVDSILAKMEYVKSRGLGGVMIEIELDDTTGICGPERPLMKAIHQGLGRGIIIIIQSNAIKKIKTRLEKTFLNI